MTEGGGMTDEPARNEFDDLVRRAKGHHVRSLTEGEKAGVLWAAAELTRLREAVERALETLDAKTGDVWWAQQFAAELRRRAGKEEG